MSPSRRCRPAPRAPLAAPAVLTFDDAVDVLTAALGPEPGIACLLLDADQRLLTCLDVGGASDTDALLDVVEVVLAVATQEGALSSIVLACHRPGSSARPEDGETCCYYELQDVFADAGLVLLDWLLVTERGIASFARLTGSGAW